MGDLPKSQSLLTSVAKRLRLASFGRTFYVLTIGSAVVYLTALLVSRFTGVIPGEIFTWPSLAVIPAAGLLLSFLFHKKPTTSDAARQVDVHTKSKDLYLTVASLENTAGNYQPLVAKEAEGRASRVKPALVVPFHWEQRAGRFVGLTALILLAILFTPQFDPFGRVEASQEIASKRKELEQSKRATLARAQQIKKDNEDGGQAEETEKSVEQLKKAFRKMDRTDKKKNFKVLASAQKSIGENWKKISDKQLQTMLSKKAADQSFGGLSNEFMKKWLKDIQRGSMDSLNKHMDSMQNDLQRLMKTTDPKEKAKIARELKKKMQQLEKFSKESANSKELAAAMKRAMKQLQMAKENGDREMAKEAMEALKESLELSKEEMKQIAQSVKDLKKLEESLKTLNKAKQLNQEEALDGQECEGCQSLDDYSEFYEQMMAERGMGEGEGDEEKDSNDGDSDTAGRGGISEEDDSLKTGFKEEKSKTIERKGKYLMELKTKGLSDAGEVEDQFREGISTIRSELSEVMEQENIPPGYHEQIKKYFDDLENVTKDKK